MGGAVILALIIFFLIIQILKSIFLFLKKMVNKLTNSFNSESDKEKEDSRTTSLRSKRVTKTIADNSDYDFQTKLNKILEEYKTTKK